MRQSITRFCSVVLLSIMLMMAGQVLAGDEPLPVIGPAPDFELITQDNTSLRLSALRGKVIALSFIFTRCAGPCPLLTAKLVGIQKQLGDAAGEDIYFVSVTIDPQYDRPDVLKSYALAMGSDLSGWVFLTGTPGQIKTVGRSYGVFHEKQSDGDVEHNVLTSLIDREGNLRVQYMGERFNPAEFLHDLQGLM